MKAEVMLYSSLEPETVRHCKLIPIDDVASAIEQKMQELGRKPTVAVLADGPQTIPYIVEGE